MQNEQGQEAINKGRGLFCGFALAPVFCLLLIGCGFSPVYADRESRQPVHAALNGIAITNIPDRQGQTLRNHLIDRMYVAGRPSSPKTKLTVSLSSTETDLGIQKDATASRRQLNMWANYALLTNDGRTLLKGAAHSVVSYSKLDAQYGTLSAERNATERALKEVGEQIVNRLSLYFAEKHQADNEG